MADWKHERARVASLTRSRTPDDPELVEARQRLKSARLSLHVTEMVNDGGLTPQDAGEIALSLLNGGAK